VLTVESASVRVSARMIMSDAASATTLVETLNDATPAALSASLGATVRADVPVDAVVAVETVTAPSPPPPSPPAPTAPESFPLSPPSVSPKTAVSSPPLPAGPRPPTSPPPPLPQLPNGVIRDTQSQVKPDSNSSASVAGWQLGLIITAGVAVLLLLLIGFYWRARKHISTSAKGSISARALAFGTEKPAKNTSSVVDSEGVILSNSDVKIVVDQSPPPYSPANSSGTVCTTSRLTEAAREAPLEANSASATPAPTSDACTPAAASSAEQQRASPTACEQAAEADPPAGAPAATPEYQEPYSARAYQAPYQENAGEPNETYHDERV